MKTDKLAQVAEALRRRKTARFPAVTVEGQMPKRVAIDVPPEFQAQEAELKKVQNLGQPEAEQPRPGSVPAQVSQAMLGAAPVAAKPLPQVDDEADIEAAREADRESRFAAGMELAGRQLVGGITRTPVPQGLGANPSEVPLAMARAKSKREQAAEALMRQRQGRLDASALDLQASQAERNRRDPGDAPMTPYQQAMVEDRDLDREARLAEQARKADAMKSKAERAAAALKAKAAEKAAAAAAKGLEDIPPGYEIQPDGHPGPEAKKKFSALVGSAEKMKGLTQKMRSALAGTSGVSRTMDPKTVTGLKQLATQIQIEAKNVAGLGALSGPDMGLMTALASDPTSIQTNLTVDLPKMLEQLDGWGDSQVAGESRATGIRKKAAAVGKPSPGPGYVRGKAGGQSGWYNAKTNDWVAD